MSSKEFKHKSIFATQVHAIEATDENRNEAKASLAQLRNLLPANINPEEEPALLFVAGNLAVAGYINLNDDGMDIDTALDTYKKFERQQINVEHDRKSVVGYIVHAGLSELGTDKIITEEEARASGKPFNIAVVIALWRAVSKDLCDYIEQASLPTSPQFNQLSLSFEVGFEDYYIASMPAGEIEIAKAQVLVKPDEQSFGKYDGCLRANKGSGFDPDDSNKKVYRIIKGGVVPLGGGIVTMPAAFVKGLTAITEQNEAPAQVLEVPIEQPVIDEAEALQKQLEAEQAAEMQRLLDSAKETIVAFVSSLNEKYQSLIKTQKTSVSSFTSINSSNMKQDIQSLKDRLSKVTKVEELSEVVASTSPILDAIVAESERQEAARKEAEAQSAKIEEAKAQALATAEELKKELDVVKSELAQIKAAQAAAAAEEAFQARMVTIDEVFDLADDERAEIVADVKDLSDEAFAKWMDKSKKLMKEKMKAYKMEKAKEMKASQDATVAKLAEKGVKVKVTDSGLDVEEIIASAHQNPVSTPAGTVIQPSQNDLKSLAAAAMKGMTFGGKKAE